MTDYKYSVIEDDEEAFLNTTWEIKEILKQLIGALLYLGYLYLKIKNREDEK